MSQFDNLMEKKPELELEDIEEMVEEAKQDPVAFLEKVEKKPKKEKIKQPKIDYEQELKDIYNPPIEYLMSAFRMITNKPYHHNKLKILAKLEEYIPRLKEKLIDLKKSKK